MTDAKSVSALPVGITPRLLTREQAAAYLAMSPTAFDTLVKAGQMPVSVPLAHPHGKRMKVARWDIRALDRAIDALSGVVPDKARAERRQAVSQRIKEVIGSKQAARPRRGQHGDHSS